MKRNAKVLALMALMAAGTASAATEAGTSITNIASAAFDIVNPDGTTKKGDPVTSNPVTTTVKAVPNFTITPNDGAPAGPTQDSPDSTLDKTARPGDTVSFPYVVTNVGNTPLVVQLDPRIASPNVDRTDTNVLGVGGSTTVIEYSYINTSGQKVILTDTNGDGLVELPVLASGASLNITQTYVIPTTATNGQFYGANPVGTAQYDSTPNPTGTGNTYTEQVNTPGTSTQLVDNDNFNRTTVERTDAVVLGPLNDPDGNGTPTTPVYTNDQGYSVTPAADDSQSTSPTVVPTTVTFQNTLQNAGNRPDVFELSTDLSQFPAGTTVTYTLPDGTALADADGDGNAETPVIQPGANFTFEVVIKYPDGTTATQVAGTDTATVTATSSNDPTKNNPTKNSVTVIVNSADFGNPTPGNPNDPNPGTVGTPPSGQPGNPSTPVTPPTTCDANATTPKAAVPVQIVNLGSVSDYYNPTGTATITLANGGTRTVAVTYYTDAALTTPLADTAADTETANPDTGLIVSGGSITLYAAVVIPCDAANGPSITLNQTVTPGSGGTPLTDTNDKITVGTAGNLVLGKFVEGGTGGTTYGTSPYVINAPTSTMAAPTVPVAFGTGEGPKVAPLGTINYAIIGKNFYNTEVRNVILTDELDLKLVNFVGATCAVYSASNTVVDAKTCTVTNTNGILTTTGMTLASGEYIRMDVAVTVK